MAKYRMYTGKQPVLVHLERARLLTAETAKGLQVQEFKGKSDEGVIAEVKDFMEHTGMPVRVITRISDGGEEVIVHRFGN